jgi:hypothetical protein
LTDSCVLGENILSVGERSLLKTGLGSLEEVRCDLAWLAVLRDGKRKLLIGNAVRQGLRTIGGCVDLRPQDEY